MADVEALITGMETYADDAVVEAMADIDNIVSAVGALANELDFANNISQWSYATLGNLAQTFINTLNQGYKNDPTLPSGIGIFPDAGNINYPIADTSIIRQDLAAWVNTLKLIPEKISKAIITFDAVNTRILTDLNNETYGINPADEMALWERTRDRESILANLLLNEIKNQFATYGIPIPQGAYVAAIEGGLNKTQENMSTVNRDISIKRADLYRITRETSIKLAMELGNAQLGITDTQIKVWREVVNAELDEIKTNMDSYKTKLSQYEFELSKTKEKQGAANALYAEYIKAWGTRLDTLSRAYAVYQQAQADQIRSTELTQRGEVERARVKVEAFNAQVNINTAALSSKAHVLANKVAGALSALNAVIGALEEKTGSI
jgi:hypothetical protein